MDAVGFVGNLKPVRAGVVACPPRRTRTWSLVAKKTPASEDAGYNNWTKLWGCQQSRIGSRKTALGSSVCRPQGKAIPDDAQDQANDVPDTGRHRNQTERRPKAEGHDFVRRRYHMEPKNKVDQPLCGTDPNQYGPETVPKSQEDSKSKTERIWVNSIHFHHLSLISSRCCGLIA